MKLYSKFWDASMKDCCCCCCYRCCRCDVRGGRDFPATPESSTFVSTLPESCELVMFHGRHGRSEAKIIEVLFLLAQLLIVTHHPRIIKNSSGNSLEHSSMILVLGDNFELVLAMSMVTLDKTFHHRIHSGRRGRNVVDCN